MFLDLTGILKILTNCHQFGFSLLLIWKKHSSWEHKGWWEAWSLSKAYSLWSRYTQPVLHMQSKQAWQSENLFVKKNKLTRQKYTQTCMIFWRTANILSGWIAESTKTKVAMSTLHSGTCESRLSLVKSHWKAFTLSSLKAACSFEISD